ncbi:MAG: hypothetical protein ACI9D1_002049, partial [Cryomorphaceae bacterium]
CAPHSPEPCKKMTSGYFVWGLNPKRVGGILA